MSAHTGIEKLTASGQLVATVFGLNRERFTGVLYVEHADGSAVFSFRHGDLVLIEDLGSEETVADYLVSRGLISEDTRRSIGADVVRELVPNEDAAFCERAVALGLLDRQALDRAMNERMRGALLRSVAWRDCTLEADADPELLAGILEYPQPVGRLLHTGIRTFYEEAQVTDVLGPGEHYLRLDVPAEEAIAYLGLDHAGRSLIANLSSSTPLGDVADASISDRIEAGQLACALVLARMGRVSPEAWLEEAPQTSIAPPPRSAAPDARIARGPVVPPEHPASAPSAPARGSSPEHARAAPRPTTGAPAVAPRPPPAERPRRRLGAALKGLDRELKVRGRDNSGRVASGSVGAPPAAPSPALNQPPVEVSPVKQLLMRKRRQLTQELHSRQVGKDQDPTGESAIPAARRLFAELAFERAHSLLQRASESTPDSQLLRMYLLYAELRAKTSLEAGPLAELRGLLREYQTDDQHAAFTYLAFGHIMLFLQKEDAAEKLFHRALELDKTSKDAERQLHILGVRRKVTAKKDKANKVFGIEIGGKRKP